MAESLTHLRLVHRLVSHIQEKYATTYNLAIFNDLPGLIGAEKPPRIGGYVPDVYALNAPLSIVVIGEAKTEGDLEKEHSHKQLTAFLSHLQSQPCGVLVLAVPWPARATAKNLLAKLQRECRSGLVQTAVLTGLPE